jgi:predicted alpha/beta hydrolase
MDPTVKKTRIVADDGYVISALVLIADSKVCGSVILSSATSIKKEYYLKFAEQLASQGFNVIIFDYRGIGESAPPTFKRSGILMHEWGTKDMNAIHDYVISEFGTTNIIWVGHSVGAQLVGFLKKPQYIEKVISVNAALGYWGYFPFPMNCVVWVLWYAIYPLMMTIYGYGTMRKIGWGEDLPPLVLAEWRKWCTNRNYYAPLLKKQLKSDTFSEFRRPITFMYTSDDYIANDRTVPLMAQFFPNSPSEVIKINVTEYTKDKVGHAGIFRKKFEDSLWPVLFTRILDTGRAS